jgi:pimeloyl-ACP methyl ester carboxylesterase
LQRAGHDALAVDLPGDDEQAGLPEYAQLVVDGAAGCSEVVLVAQSLGGFTAPLAAEQLPVTELVLVNAMIPVPGETPGQWWQNTGAIEARTAAAASGGYGDFDLVSYFLHDVPPAVAAEGERYQRPEAEAVFQSVCDFKAWPATPIRVLSGADDRFFPADFQRRVAQERLGIEPDVHPGGHLIALAQPRLVAEYLLHG